MGFEGLLKIIAEKFKEAHVRYALIGGLAMHTAGYHRATGDLDFLIHTDDVDKAKVILGGMKYKLIHESLDVLSFSSPWELIGGVDFIKAHRPYALAMLERAKVCRVSDGIELLTAVVEDIIGLKVQAMSNDPSRMAKDLADIEWLVSSRQDMNMGDVKRYFALFSLEGEFEKILKRCRDA